MSLSVQELTVKRRSEFDVKLAVLRAISSGESSSTNIIYRTRTSWGVVSRILKIMQQQKLISTTIAGRRASYALTEKGINVLNTYKNIVSQLDSNFEAEDSSILE